MGRLTVVENYLKGGSFEDLFVYFEKEDIAFGLNRGDNLAEKLENIYEAEWKLAVVEDNLRKHPSVVKNRRLNNIKDRIKRKIRPVMREVADKFLEVFKDWSESHTLDAEEWAEVQMQDNFLQRQLKDMNLEGVVTHLEGFINWKPFDIDLVEAVRRWIEKNGVSLSLEDQLLRDASGMEGDRAEEIRQAVNEEDADFIAEYIRPILSADLSIIDAITDRDLNAFFKQVAKNQTFPEWKEHWVARGIDQTIEIIDDITEELENFSARDINEASLIINRAVNATHQTGSMLDHVGREYPSVSEALLDDLSGGPQSQWVKDIQDAGLELPEGWTDFGLDVD